MPSNSLISPSRYPDSFWELALKYHEWEIIVVVGPLPTDSGTIKLIDIGGQLLLVSFGNKILVLKTHLFSFTYYLAPSGENIENIVSHNGHTYSSFISIFNIAPCYNSISNSRVNI